MIDKIAMAISGKGESGWAALPDTEKDRLYYSAVWHDAGETKADYRDDARAALEALLEPSEAMIDAGDDTDVDGVSLLSPGESRHVWQAMIQAALEEK